MFSLRFEGVWSLEGPVIPGGRFVRVVPETVPTAPSTACGTGQHCEMEEMERS